MREVRVGVVEGNLVLEEGSIVVPEGERVVVKGSVICRGFCVFRGPLEARALRARGGDVEVEGDLVVERLAEVKEGSLYVEGLLRAARVRVDDSCEVSRRLEASHVSVGGVLRAEDIAAEFISVGGTLRAERMRSERVSVGGSLEVSEIEVEKASVGGAAKVGRGVFSSSLSVGGSLELGEARAARISVGGVATLEGGEVDRLSVGGALEVRGPLKAEKVSAGGTARISEGFKGGSISVGGRLELQGDSEVEKVSVGGSLSARGVLRAKKVSVGGLAEVEKLIAEEVEVSSLRAEVGVWARTLSVGERGRVEGLVVAEEVYMERGGRAEKVYAKLFECEEGCHVRELYAEDAFVGDMCRVERINYVRELQLGRGVKVGASEKVGEIEFPKDP